MKILLEALSGLQQGFKQEDLRDEINRVLDEHYKAEGSAIRTYRMQVIEIEASQTAKAKNLAAKKRKVPETERVNVREALGGGKKHNQQGGWGNRWGGGHGGNSGGYGG